MGSQTSEVRGVLDGIRRLVRALRLTARSAEDRVGVSAAQLFILQNVAQAPGCSLKELAHRTATDPSSVSVVVARLEERGLVARRRSPRDGRQVEIALTAKGRLLERKAPPAAQDSLIRSLALLTDEERGAFAHLLERVVHGMGLGKSPAPMFFESDGRPAISRAPRSA
jgi:DNA-binding MarR family transcriptional regulator